MKSVFGVVQTGYIAIFFVYLRTGNEIDNYVQYSIYGSHKGEEIFSLKILWECLTIRLTRKERSKVGRVRSKRYYYALSFGWHQISLLWTAF